MEVVVFIGARPGVPRPGIEHPAPQPTLHWRLFRGASTVRNQLAVTDGVIGFALLACPLAKQYATLSLWRDEDALAAFAGAEPHRGLMSELSPEMGPTKFVRWTMRGADGRPSWRDALQRLSWSSSHDLQQIAA